MTRSAKNTVVFRDPVHGIIRLGGADGALAELLDTGAMQRLRRVRQMGFASLVYPGAEHSRFGHALGAFAVATRVTEHLGLSSEHALAVKAAALLHDVGHGPFSHAWEEALEGPSHESWGQRVVTEDPQIIRVLGDISPELPRAMQEIFARTYRPRVVVKLVSSQLDVDRMDYLLRDAHYSGVRYSAYDLDWIIHALAVRDVGESVDSRDLVVDWRRGMHAVEQYLSGRFYMYAQVYYHKTVRAAEALFLAIMRRFAELTRAGNSPLGLPVGTKLAAGQAVDIAEFTRLDDPQVWTAIVGWTEHSDAVLSDLCGRLVDRRLFKSLEAGDDPAIIDRVMPELAEAARGVFGDRARHYFTVDHAGRLSYDPRPGEEIYVVGHPRHDSVDLGQLLGSAASRFQVRVLCAPELRERFAPIVAAALRGASS